MSRSNAAKKARRKKRLATRNESWLPASVHADAAAIRRIADVLLARGWEYDEDLSAGQFLTWFYEPSAVELDDDEIEPVTRVWLTDLDEPHAILVGSTETGVDYQFTVEDLFEHLDAIEAYRMGDPEPSF